MNEPMTPAALANLHPADPIDFVRERRRLLDQFINGKDCPKNELSELQQSIDHTIAVSGTPMCALGELASQIEDRLTLISQLSRRLIEQLNDSETASAGPSQQADLHKLRT
jgi:hypothetical protein